MGHFQKLFSFLLITLLIVPSTKPQDQTQQLITDASYYYNLCAPSTCNNVTLPYPLTPPTPCHPSPLEIVCPNNQTFYTTSRRSTDKMRVLSINYPDPITTTLVEASENLFTCGSQISKKNYVNDATVFSLPLNYTFGTHLNCTSPIPENSIQGLQNASCLGCAGQDPFNVCYYAPGFVTAPNCEMFHIFTLRNVFNASSVVNLREYLQSGFTIVYTKPLECRGCEASGGRCGAKPLSGSFICFCPSSVHTFNCTDGLEEDISAWISPLKSGRSGLPRLVIIAVICASILLLIVGVLVLVWMIHVHRRKHIFHTNNVVAISTISPTRYSYSQLKKFTNNFSSKIGEGGFGSVYKGAIHQGASEIQIAVKILKTSGQTQKQFMNEVGTIGTIHHQNLVSLLGYCVARGTHMLVYEFLEQGSLDKYIYNEDKTDCRRLTSKEMYNIALETARGILYLHGSCSNKILHCGIKPPNILLDSNFSAKVADFGLAKMIDKDHSHASLTYAQGTPGYTAPEIWLKGLGPVTEKSDVYSYGMLLLEMVGRRKNYNEEASNPSQVYFPEWIYNKVDRAEFPLPMNEVVNNDSFDILPAQENVNNDADKFVEQMSVVGIWCIQHVPWKRPRMNEVVQMLEGHVVIQKPPYPFPQNSTIDDGGLDKDGIV